MAAAHMASEEESVMSASPAAVGTPDSEPVLWASTNKITLTAGHEWLRRNNVGPGGVWEAGRTAVLLLEGQEDGEPLEPCSRCTTRSNVLVSVLSGVRTDKETDRVGPLSYFVFNNCRSRCNSSRLHLGGRVVVCVELHARDGPVAARVLSQPISFCSKSSSFVCRRRTAGEAASCSPKTHSMGPSTTGPTPPALVSPLMLSLTEEMPVDPPSSSSVQPSTSAAPGDVLPSSSTTPGAAGVPEAGRRATSEMLEKLQALESESLMQLVKLQALKSFISQYL
eukprot:m51a1_g14109 hypothetical protein (281) ;mRNA; f:114061-115414